MNKEIEVYIYSNHLPWFFDNCDSITVHKNIPENSGPLTKAKLIIDLPEKSVTITEKDFADAVWFADKTYHNTVVSDEAWVNCFKQKLFGKES